MMRKLRTHDDWFERARDVLPGAGFGNFDSRVILSHGKGSRVWDTEGKEYIDYLIGSGPMLLGHGHPEVLEAVLAQLPRGATFFANNTAGIELAETICEAVPCAEQVRFVSSGGEADMYAIRLARAFTGREKILKFEGGYHGMCAEAQMSLAPRQASNFPQAQPDSAGIPESVREEVLVAPYNDPEFLHSVMTSHGSEIAAVLVEPLQRIIPAEEGYLATLKQLCKTHGALLIFDEIVTGFRLAYGGAQEAYGVIPDVCTLGKVIGGGFPLAAVAARGEIMAHFDKARVGPEGWLMQLGTLSGNPVASVAGLKTLEILRRDGAYETLRTGGERVMAMLSSALAEIPHQIVGEATIFDVAFTKTPVRNYRDYQAANHKISGLFNEVLRTQGLLKSPGKTYASLALTDDDFAQTHMAINTAASAIASIS